VSTKNLVWSTVLMLGLAVTGSSRVLAADNAVNGWLDWRGPHQNGTSDEKGTPEKWTLNGENHLFTLDIKGRGAPVVAGDKVYAWGYTGEGADMRETLVCLDAETGKIHWQKFFNDFMSDTVYDRYSIGAPTVDPATGYVYLLTTPGDFYCFTGDGKQVWMQPMMERFGRLTFPSSRTGSPAIDGQLVIVHSVTANWGGEGPARDRFYAFDKTTGEPVWGVSPGVGAPFLKDNSFATCVFAWDAEGRRVFYSATGDGTMCCVNANTGQAIWRAQLAVGGINSTPVLYKNLLIAPHSVLDLNTNKQGGIYAIDVTAKPGAAPEGQEQAALPLGKDAIKWQDPRVSMFTASPTLVGNRVYQVDQNGTLWCMDAETGSALWEKKLAPDQIHASMVYADGKLYVPMNSGGGDTLHSLFYILKPNDKGADELAKVIVDGNCLGAPAVWNGKVYFFTNQKFYAFGHKGQAKDLPVWPKREERPAGKPVALQVIPYDVVLTPGKSQKVEVWSIDAAGQRVAKVEKATWAKFIPPTAKVKSEADATVSDEHVISAAADAKLSAGAFQGTSPEGLKGVFRARVMQSLPIKQDFEAAKITDENPIEHEKFGYPPLPWIGARFKWDVREKDGNKLLSKTLDSLLFQRAMTFFGTPDMSNYTVEADVMTDGGRRGSSEVGVINQRYIIELVGNAQVLEINSNHERIKVSVPFKFETGTWYHVKTRVDVATDGSGVVRAKAWKKGESEPEKWTLEVPHKHAHTHGAPGVFGFAPQNKFRCYVDNVVVTPNK
jgi:outer membrane protein assembly factor BamB